MAERYTCYVCTKPIRGEDPHTYHDELCPVYQLNPCQLGTDAICTQEDGCGEDCHADCCPICLHT